MLYSLREETEGKLQMRLSPRKNGVTSLFKEVRGGSPEPSRLHAASPLATALAVI